MNGRPNIVLVHGAWADGSCWSGVIERLQADGFQVRAPQFPLSSLADDVARLRQVLEFQDGPTIVVGHSYGGQIITALGTDAPNVVGLVYIAAFALDEGESLGALLSQGPVTPALAHLFTDSRGFGWLSEDDFVNHFAGDVEPTRARVLYAVQQPLASSAFTDVMGAPAWKSLPSWYLVAQNDEAIPPDAERQFAARMGATTVEIPSSHVAMVSHPAEVADLVEKAAEASAPPLADARTRRTVDAHATTDDRRYADASTQRVTADNAIEYAYRDLGDERRAARPAAALPRQPRQLGPRARRRARRRSTRDHVRQRRRRRHDRQDAEHDRGDGPRCDRLPRGDGASSGSICSASRSAASSRRRSRSSAPTCCGASCSRPRRRRARPGCTAGRRR